MSNPTRRRPFRYAAALLVAVALGGGHAAQAQRATTPQAATTDALFAKMSAVEADILAIAAQLEQLTGQMKDVLVEEPVAPSGTDARAKAAWQNEHDAWEQRVAQLAATINDKRKALAEAQSKLQALRKQDLPAAQAKDQENALERLEAEAKALEALLQEATTELDRAHRSWLTRPVSASVVLADYGRASTTIGKLKKAAGAGLPPR